MEGKWRGSGGGGTDNRAAMPAPPPGLACMNSGAKMPGACLPAASLAAKVGGCIRLAGGGRRPTGWLNQRPAGRTLHAARGASGGSPAGADLHSAGKHLDHAAMHLGCVTAAGRGRAVSQAQPSVAAHAAPRSSAPLASAASVRAVRAGQITALAGQISDTCSPATSMSPSLSLTHTLPNPTALLGSWPCNLHPPQPPPPASTGLAPPRPGSPVMWLLGSSSPSAFHRLSLPPSGSTCTATAGTTVKKPCSPAAKPACAGRRESLST